MTLEFLEEEKLRLENEKLKEYLALLPSQDEWQEKKDELDVKIEECLLLNQRLNAVRDLADKNSEAVGVAEARNRILELANEDLKKELCYEKMRHDQKKNLLDQPNNESVKEMIETTEMIEKLSNENKKLKKYFSIIKEKHKTQVLAVENQLKVANERISHLSQENEALQTREKEERKSNTMLRNQVKRAFGQVADLRGEAESLRQSLKAAHRHEENYERHLNSISEVRNLYQQLASLSQALVQISLDQEDPNISNLLGIAPVSPLLSSPSSHNDVRPDVANAQDFETEIQDLINVQQKQLEDLRKIVLEKYADKIADKSADNCLTQ